MDSKSYLSSTFLRLLVVVVALLYSLETRAGTSQPVPVVQTTGEEVGSGRQQVERFYEALERLIYAYGEDHYSWPDNEDKRLIQEYLEKKDALTLDNCIFGLNLLGLGIGESPDDAKEALRQGQKDAWAVPYSLILASSVGAPKPFNLLFGIAVYRGAPIFNRNICEKVFIFMKADMHSQFADVFKNFNGESVLFMARELNIMGAPGSAQAGYAQELKPALCAADCLRATIYIGEKDRVTSFMPKSIRDTISSLFGVKITFPIGTNRKVEGCLHEVPIQVVHLEACDHDVAEYHRGMSAHGTTMLKTKGGLP